MLWRHLNAQARLALALYASPLAATLAYFSIRNARAVHQASLGTRSGYETAARLEPGNAENWYLLGRYWQYTLDEPDARRAVQNYRHALFLNPRSADTWLHLAAALPVWQRLVTIHPALRLSDATPFSDLLIQKHQIRDARRVWDDALRLSSTPQNLDPPGSVLWDGGFETGVRGGAFAWAFPAASGGVQSSFDARQKHSGKYSLRLAFDGLHNVNFDGVCNHAQVRPDTDYRPSAWVRTQTLTTDQGARLRLSWYSDSHPGSFSETTDVQGTQPWTLLEMPWTSGKDVRYARVCVVRNVTGKFYNQLHATAWA